MKFKKEELIELIDFPVSEEIIDQSRWTTCFRYIFEYESKFYECYADRGSTECQDYSLFEFESDEIECPEVEEVEITVKQWKVKEVEEEK
jgi:hypothetical protein